MIPNIKNFKINLISLINLTFSFFPISFVLGNLALNINTVLFCCLGIFHLKSKLLNSRFNLVIKIIFLFFIAILFSTILSFVKSLFFDNFEYYNLIQLTKSIIFFRFFLMLIIIYLLSQSDILVYKYLFLSATFATVIVSLDVIYQYIFGFDIVGYKNFDSYNPGFFGDELIAGGFIKNFSFLSILFIILAFKNNKNFSYILASLAICILGTGILLSGNRMPLLFFLFGFFMLFLFNVQFKKILSVGLLILFITSGFLVSSDNKIKNSYLSYYINAQFVLDDLFNKSKRVSKSEFQDRKEIAKKVKVEGFEGFIDARDEWHFLDKSPQWVEGNAVRDDFEFFWVLQTEHDAHTKIYATALDTWRQNKIFGNGIKSFRKDCKKLSTHKMNRLCSSHPHNYYLEILTDTGIVGLFIASAIGLFFLIFIFKNFRFFKEKHAENFFLLAVTISLILETFPIKSTGSLFSTYNATYLILMASILISNKKIIDLKSHK